MTGPLVILGVALGLVIGSFLTVVAHRVPSGDSVASPPSSCPVCGHRIRPRDNVPVLSWILLRGRCRDCGTRISTRYPLVEVATAALFAVVPLVVAAEAAPAFWLLAAAGVVLTLTDLDHKRIPNRILFPSIAAGTVLLGVAALVDGDVVPFLRALGGGAAYFGLMLLVAIAARGGFGYGDVKLAFLLGEFAGFVSWATVVVAVFAAFFLGGVVGALLLVTRRVGRKSSIPFGPAMIAGAFVAVVWGDALAEWYL